MKIKQNLSKYDVDEGFEEYQNNSEPVVQLNQDLSPICFFSNSKSQPKSRSSPKKEEAKLRNPFLYDQDSSPSKEKNLEFMNTNLSRKRSRKTDRNP